MVAAAASAQSSLLDLARAGDFSALAYWINRALIPDGFYARVDGHRIQGCVDICVEFPVPRTAAYADVQSNLIRRICHQLWQLNSKVIHGVQVSGSVSGRAEILWQQTVRIVTPANQQRSWPGAEALSWGAIVRPVMRGASSVCAWTRSRYKTLRLLLLAGSAAAVFALGSWLSSHSALEWVSQHSEAGSGPTPIVQPDPRATLKNTSPNPPAPTQDNARSGLARIQTVLSQWADPRVTPIAPPANRVQAEDVVLLIGGDLDFAGPLAGNNAQAFADLGALAAADVTAVTLESPLSSVAEAEAQFQVLENDLGDLELTRSPAAVPQSRPQSETQSETQSEASASPSGAIAALSHAGVDLINLANARLLDDGEPGLAATLAHLRRANIATLGAGHTVEDAARAQILKVKGIKIAYLGYATADYTTIAASRSGINEAQRSQIRRDIANLRDRADWIVVNYHWGHSATSYPAHWQTQLARDTIDAGADAVIGHSPNLLQGAETYQDRPIVYSLGKLLYGDRYGFGGETALLRLRLTDASLRADFVPIKIWDGRPVAATAESARWIVQHIEDLSQGFERPLAQLAQDVDGISEPPTASDPDFRAISFDLATQALSSSRILIEQSLPSETMSEDNPPPVEIDVDFQHPDLPRSRRNLTQELAALNLGLAINTDGEAPSSEDAHPSSAGTIAPGPQLPSLTSPLSDSKTVSEPLKSGTNLPSDSPFSPEPIVTRSPAPLPERLPQDGLISGGRSIGQWSRTLRSPSFMVPNSSPARDRELNLPNW